MSLRKQFTELPIRGLTAVEVAQALQFLATTEFSERSIITVNPRPSGHVLVTTGEMRGLLSGGGLAIILSRTENGWTVAESYPWLS